MLLNPRPFFSAVYQHSICLSARTNLLPAVHLKSFNMALQYSVRISHIP